MGAQVFAPGLALKRHSALYLAIDLISQWPRVQQK